MEGIIGHIFCVCCSVDLHMSYFRCLTEESELLMLSSSHGQFRGSFISQFRF